MILLTSDLKSSLEQDIYNELKAKLKQLIDQYRPSISEVASATNLLAEDYTKIIKNRYPE